jgi:hypothetical protein
MLGLLALLIPAALASAQAVSTAQMSGRVRDGSGGALPGVTVTATQTATGLSGRRHPMKEVCTFSRICLSARTNST